MCAKVWRAGNQQRLRRGIHLAAVCLLAMLAPLPVIAETPANGHWVGSWANAPFAQSNSRTPDFAGATFRQIAHNTLAGKSLRIRFTNEFGTEPLEISAAHVAISAGHGTIQPETDHPVTFNGKPSIIIPPGSIALSDVVAMATPPFADLAITCYFPSQQIDVASFHGEADQTSYLQKGNFIGAAKFDSPVELTSWYFLKGVDVETTAESAAAVVTLGDSITDGVHSSLDANRRWPDILAHRLQSNEKTSNLAVLNAGMGANRLLHDGTGPNALARFDRDVLTQSGVKYVIVLEGINDIGRLVRNNDPADAVTAEDMEMGLQQLAARAHDHNIKIFAATITPFKGAGYYSEKGEVVRGALNQWIRTSGVFDGVVDFDKVVRDPANPLMLLPAYDSHDHLHPNDAGYSAMGNAIDLSFFQ
ncbi:MAG TPA: SGNH/GDSL hydrolase family protein [Acidisarcina sp.]|nr:SGNH/GDSL hydrolase family protein [Acidisarcina sp.]